MVSQKKVAVGFVYLSHERRESTWLLTCNHISSPWNSWSVACKTLSWVTGALNRSKLYLTQTMCAWEFLYSTHWSYGKCILITLENSDASFGCVFRFFGRSLVFLFIVFLGNIFLLLLFLASSTSMYYDSLHPIEMFGKHYEIFTSLDPESTNTAFTNCCNFTF